MLSYVTLDLPVTNLVMVQYYYIVVMRFSPCLRMVIKEIEDNERWI